MAQALFDEPCTAEELLYQSDIQQFKQFNIDYEFESNSVLYPCVDP